MAKGLPQQVLQLTASGRGQRRVPGAEFLKSARIRKYTTQERDSSHGDDA